MFLHNVFLSKLSYCELQNGCFQFELSSEVLSVCFTAHARRVLYRSLSSAPVVLELHLSFLVSTPNPNPTPCHLVPASVLRFSVTRMLELHPTPKSPTGIRAVLKVHNHSSQKTQHPVFHIQPWFSKTLKQVKELTPQEICQFFSGCFVKTVGSLRVLKYLELANI